MTNAQFQPLADRSVGLEVYSPDGSLSTVTLQADATRPGTFAGQLTVLQEGEYRLELPVPQSDNQRLPARHLQVALPDLERENPQRNDPLLGRLAKDTGGVYYAGIEAAIGPKATDPLVAHLKDRSKTSVLTAAPDPLWEETWLKWMMLALCGLLCGEWLIRRLLKLA